MYTKEELTKKVIDASQRYLQMQGMEVLEQDYECPFGSVDIVARDGDGVIRFVHCYASRWNLPAVQTYDAESRSKFERIAISWLAEHDDMVDAIITFDAIDIGVFGPDYGRAILRHHRNVLEQPDASVLAEAS